MSDISQKTPNIIVCADDFALSPGVSSGICDLLERERISATSCMAVSAHWPSHAEWLNPYRCSADIGLHLTLTGLKPLTPMPRMAGSGILPDFTTLLKMALTGRLAIDEIATELERQIDTFIEVFGKPPAFVDGHHHIHQLPGIRDIVLSLFRRRLSGSGTYLRVTASSMPDIFRRGISVGRAMAIALPGAGMQTLARREGIPVNSSFAGVYDFSGDLPYAEVFGKFLVGARAQTLIMCHPGFADPELRQIDSLTDQRKNEYDFFKSDTYFKVLESAGVRLGRFSQCA